MKPSPQYEFPLSVRRQTWEEESEVAAFYDGIFDAVLNYSVSVMFEPGGRVRCPHADRRFLDGDVSSV